MLCELNHKSDLPYIYLYLDSLWVYLDCLVADDVDLSRIGS